MIPARTPRPRSPGLGAPDVAAMERNIARKMPRPNGWAQGKASWKAAGGLPPGRMKARGLARKALKPPRMPGGPRRVSGDV